MRYLTILLVIASFGAAHAADSKGKQVLSRVAESECKYNYASHSVSVEEYIKRFVSGKSLTLILPIQLAEELIAEGCQDGDAIAGFVAAVSANLMDRKIFDRDLYSDFTPGAPNKETLELAVQLHLLGEPEFLERILAIYTERRDDGDAKAATALAVLGGRGSFLDELFSHVRDWGSFIYESPELFAHPNFAINEKFGNMEEYIVEVRDPRLLEINRRLADESTHNLEIGIREGFAPAYLYYFAAEDFKAEPCSDITRDNAHMSQMFLRLPDPERAVQAVKGYAEDIARQNTRRIDTPYSMASFMALIFANITSDCAYSTHQPDGSFGVFDPVVGEKLAHLAGVLAVKGDWPDDDVMLALAAVIEERSADEGAKYAAARLFVNAAPLSASTEKMFGRSNLFDAWLPRFSPQTVVEAQKMLQQYGYYTGAIDGIPGPAFRAAILAFEGECVGARKQKLDICLPDRLDPSGPPWLSPYLEVSAGP